MKFLPQIESQLESLLTFPSCPQEKLFEAARHIVLGSGKRLRPLLLLSTVSAFEGSIEQAIQPACALEILHAYSLIHDDLPCMDDDDYRRGKLTLHKKYDEATAVLTGDFLLTYAFEILSESPGLTDHQKIKMIQILSKKAGGEGMIAGQLLDLEACQHSPSLDRLKLIHQRKTADLFAAAFEMGGLIAQVSSHFLSELRAFGEEIGLAFQIIDDVIDITASVEKHGKSISSDAINGKTTYVSHLGIEGAKAAANHLISTSLKRLEAFPNGLLIKEITDSFILN